MAKLPGEATSLWLATTPQTKYPALQYENSECDVAIIGGGITGILCAWKLQKAGLDCVLIEKDRIVENTTGNTTAKLTSQHYLVYQDLVKEQGHETAQAYAQANEKAINDIEKLVKAEAIDCDFARSEAFVFTNDDKAIKSIAKEVDVTQELGLPSSYQEKIDLPLKIKAAIKFSNQALFHPRKFLLPLAEELVKMGGRIYEETEAKDIETSTRGQTVITKNAKVKAKSVIEATKYPFWKPKMFAGAYWTKLSYALGVKLKGSYPKAMYINVEDPTRTIRSHPDNTGQVLIFGGESHKMTQNYSKDEHYRDLVEDVRRKFDVERILYRWIAGDAMSNDKMPYIGEYPRHKHVYVITGYRAWGLAWAMAASDVIVGEILGEPLAWAKPFGLQRLKS